MENRKKTQLEIYLEENHIQLDPKTRHIYDKFAADDSVCVINEIGIMVSGYMDGHRADLYVSKEGVCSFSISFAGGF